MKKLLSIFIFTLSFSISHAQNGWNYLPAAPNVALSGRFDDLYFINDSTGVAVNGDGQIYKTTDFGASWILELDSFQYYFRSVEFINDTIGFAGTLNGVVFKTTDAGVTWFHIEQTFPQQVPGVCGIGHFGNIIIMEGIWNQPAYILRSIDFGNTWTYIDMSSLAGGLIDCWFKNQDTVFVSGQGTNATSKHGVILRSVDGGITWQQAAQSPIANAYCWKLQFTSPSVGYASREEMTSGTSNIMKTTDGGTMWFSVNVTNQNIDMEGIGFLNDSVGWVGGWSLGMYQTNNGGLNWSYVNFGENLNRFVFRHPNLAYAAGLSIYKFTGITTNVSENPLAEKYIHQFEIFPNPASDCINFKLQINKNTTAIFDVYNETGQWIKTFTTGAINKNDYNFNWDVSRLSKGNYYAVLRTNEHFLTKKFVVE